MRVLFVDDELDFLATLIKRLTRRGISAVGVGTGEEALTRMAQQTPNQEFDVVVLDVRMPGMGGLAALSELRARYPLTPVIMLTAHADMQDAMAGLERGAFCYLLKPVDLDTLLWRIQDAHREKVLLLEGRETGKTCPHTRKDVMDSSAMELKQRKNKEKQE